MKLTSLNNATVIIESNEDHIMIDPWLIGDLYQGSWSPSISLNDFSILKKINKVFITHLHKDHWDSETIKHFNPDVEFYIPNLTFNKIITDELKNMGFSNIYMKDLKEWFDVNEDLSCFCIPPLNSGAQDEEFYKDHSNISPTAIDTGFIFSDKSSKTNHLILCDNSPYDIEFALNNISNIKIDSLWFPFNGYAGDFPLCYDNFSLKEKKEFSALMSRKRESLLIELVSEINPSILIPHSSDFLLNGIRQKEFFDVHEEEFIFRDSYAKRIQNKTNIPSYSLSQDDYLSCCDGQIKIIKKSKNKNFQIPKNKDLFFPNGDFSKNFEDELKSAFKNMLERAERYKLPMEGTEDWNLIIAVNEDNFCFKFKDKSLEKISNDNLLKLNKKLILRAQENILRCLLEGKIRFDNAQIGCYLSWERTPKTDFNINLYGLLNFLYK